MRIASIAAGAVIAFAASLGATAAFAQSLQFLGPSDASENGRTGVTGFNELWQRYFRRKSVLHIG